MLYLKIISRWFVTVFELVQQKFLSLHIVLSFLAVMFLSSAALAEDIVVSNENVSTTPQLVRIHSGITQVDIVKPQKGISRNQFKQYNVGVDGIVINNSISGKSVEELGFISGNKKLTEPAKIILLEVTGEGCSELLGKITIIGEQAKIILANSKGIIC